MKNVLPVAKGLATLILPDSLYQRTQGGSVSPRYCYSVLLRHLSLVDSYCGRTGFRRVAELGPGDSIGIGLAALLAGSERYDGFDVKKYDIPERTWQVFESLVQLLQKREPIPNESEFPQLRPILGQYDFPQHILTAERLARSLDSERLSRIRSDLRRPSESSMIGYMAPWDASSMVDDYGDIDWIFSQAVMEHVERLKDTYAACYAWLRPGGIMTHQIDFRSHDTAVPWNGHWTRSDVVWWAIRGARPFLLNREPCSRHIVLIKEAGFIVKGVRSEKRSDGVDRSQLTSEFRSMSELDLVTASAFIVAEKPTC